MVELQQKVRNSDRATTKGELQQKVRKGTLENTIAVCWWISEVINEYKKRTKMFVITADKKRTNMFDQKASI